MDILSKKIKSMYRTSIVFSIILFALGLFLLINPETTLHAISYIVGTVLIISGIIPVLSYFLNKDTQNYLNFGFILGVFIIIFGIIVIIKPNLIGSIIPFLVGIWMMINGVTKLFYALNLNKEGDAISSIVISLLILVSGLLLLINPFGGAIVLTQFIGISVIIYSVLDLLECYTLKKAVKVYSKDAPVEEKKSKKRKDDKKIIEAEYEEE